MTKPHHFIDIFLQPGEFYFGDRETRIRTLLGSCVAITMWNPRLLIGGMCHYMLPERRGSQPGIELDGRYADNVMLMFMRELEKTGSRPADYNVKMFGGGSQFESLAGRADSNVPEKNVQAGRQLLHDYGFHLTTKHMGGQGYRNVIFDIWNGHVWVRPVDNSATGVKV